MHLLLRLKHPLLSEMPQGTQLPPQKGRSLPCALPVSQLGNLSHAGLSGMSLVPEFAQEPPLEQSSSAGQGTAAAQHRRAATLMPAFRKFELSLSFL